MDSIQILVTDLKKQPQGTWAEVFLPNQRYLLILRSVAYPQEMFADFPDLDPQLSYYRAVDYYAGTTRFPADGDNSENAKRDRVTIATAQAISEALSPSDPLQKLNRLRTLQYSTDLMIRSNAEIAIRALDGSAR